MPQCDEAGVGFILEFVMFVTLRCTNMKIPFKVTRVYQVHNLFLLKKMFKICQSESLNSLVREIALNCMAACSHYIMCKPKGTDDAGF